MTEPTEPTITCPDCGAAAEVVQFAKHGESGTWHRYADLSCGHRVIVTPTGD